MRRLLALAGVMLVAGCGPVPPTPTVAAPTDGQTLATVAPSPTAPPSAALATAAVSSFVVDQVVYAGHAARFTFEAYDEAAAGATHRVATIRIAYGDGTTDTLSPGCASSGPIAVVHSYAAAGQYRVSVQAATLCDAAWHADQESPGILVLAAAPADATTWPRCSTFQLAMRGRNRGSALSNGGATVSLTNVGSTSCRLQGYPALTLIAPDGSSLPTALRHDVDGAYLFPAIPEGLVALVPGGEASFQISYGAVSGGPDAGKAPFFGCPPVARVRVTLPSSNQFGTADLTFAPCDGIVGVTPVFPGSSWISFQ